MSVSNLYTDHWGDYELIAAGGGRNLERWGNMITIRPELQAYFHSGLPFSEWKKMAHWEFIEKKGKKGGRKFFSGRRPLNSHRFPPARPQKHSPKNVSK